MSDASAQPGGWTIPRALGLIFGLLIMAGFGLCSLLALVVGFRDPYWLTILPFVIAGLGLTLLGFLLVRKMILLIRGASK